MDALIYLCMVLEFLLGNDLER